jgi:hypothetical protein
VDRRRCIREAGRRDGRCLIGSALKLGDYDLVERTKVGMSKWRIVGGERVEGYLSTGFNGLAQTPCRIKRWSLIISASSITKLVDTDVCERYYGAQAS